MAMYEGPVVYVDIETSGGSFKRSQIIEVAAIRVEDGQVTQEFSSLVNPGTNLPHWITKLTGITENDVVQAPNFADIAYQLHQVLDGAIFIAHNVRFDYSYIKRQLAASGYSYRPKLLCTVRLSRALYPSASGHSLEKLIARHKIPVAGRHRAYDDAKAIKDFAELAYAEHGPYLFDQALDRQFKSRSLPANLDEASFDPIENKPGVYVFEDEFGQPIYIGKSVTMRNRVLSHFNAAGDQAKEMQMAQNVHKLRVVETSNELEALLLESEMIKELLPVHNRRLKRHRNHLVFVKNSDERGYTTIHIETQDIATFSDLHRIYGVYTSQAKAKHALQEKLKTYTLCSKLLGLENTKGACFLYQLGKCKGACVGKESAKVYNVRVELALQRSKVESWPYESAVVINSGQGKSLVVNKWVVLGYLSDVEATDPHFKAVERNFDIDTYRILRSYIKKNIGSLSIKPIPLRTLQQYS